jgi:glycosyltransferase involved in cell wall biosynthesis
MTSSVIAIDVKNLALYGAGISGYVRPLLHAWISARPRLRFVLISPEWDHKEFGCYPNCEFLEASWPQRLPRALRHPTYDNLIFPAAIRRINPDFVFSPYHDVRLPAGVPSCMTIHDTCVCMLKGVYPKRVRRYYEWMLKVNLSRARHILTVSHASRLSILDRYSLQDSRVSIIPNILPAVFLGTNGLPSVSSDMESMVGEDLRLLYTGGADHRKNIDNLLSALALLVARGKDAHLYVTGLQNERWNGALSCQPDKVKSYVHFLGWVSEEELCYQYQRASAVVYPSFCEGFGRACLEAMSQGTPLACSELEVFREVAGDYALYFDPHDAEDMAVKILGAARSGRRMPRHNPDYEKETVTCTFVELMDRLLEADSRYTKVDN